MSHTTGPRKRPGEKIAKDIWRAMRKTLDRVYQRSFDDIAPPSWMCDATILDRICFILVKEDIPHQRVGQADVFPDPRDCGGWLSSVQLVKRSEEMSA